MNAVRFARDITQTGAPGEIRTSVPQIRSLVLAQQKKNHITGRITCETRAISIREPRTR